ncbi:MAG: 4Fe-4S dicluster domain-containing protein [Promethearchaeota archaeon]
MVVNVNENAGDGPVNVNDLDLDFRHELSNMINGESLLNCIQCGVCSSGCTVSEWMDLQPHLVVSSLLLGMKDRVLNSKAIWTCSLCHRCTERCPKSVDYSFLLALLRNLAMKGGNAPPEYLVDLTNIHSAGFALPMNDMMAKSVNRRREKLNLPPLAAADVDTIRKIIEITGLNRFLGGDEKNE